MSDSAALGAVKILAALGEIGDEHRVDALAIAIRLYLDQKGGRGRLLEEETFRRLMRAVGLES